MFLLIIASLVVLAATWLVLPSITAARQEKIESDLNRGVTSARVAPSKAAARAQAAEFAETHRGFKEMGGTERYQALTPRCRELVDAHVALVDTYLAPLETPAATSTDGAKLVAGVEDTERKFGAECADNPAAAPAAASATQPEMSEMARQHMCTVQRETAERVRASLERTRVEGSPPQGVIDERQMQLNKLDAEIAASCR